MYIKDIAIFQSLQFRKTKCSNCNFKQPNLQIGEICHIIFAFWKINKKIA